MKVIVIGGGISGLACAHFLRKAGDKAGHDVWLVEPHQPGGVMGSSRLEGFLCERGPQALLANSPAVQTLIDDLGLRARALAPKPAARRRCLYSRGRLHDVPMSPPALLGTSLLSWRGRLRLLGEPFIGRRSLAAEASPESLRDFAARRLGAEAADRLLTPAVMAVYAGDARLLEAASAFPSLVEWERDHGSLLLGALATARLRRRQQHGLDGKQARGIVSFPEGLSELASAITAELGDHWIRGRATALARSNGNGNGNGSPSAGTWRVSLAATSDGQPTLLEGDAVILACDRTASAQLLQPLAPEAARALREIPLAPTAVVHLGFRGPASQLGMALDAYGFIASRDEGVALLGCQYETSIFAGRAPEGQVLLRAIVGGSFDPTALNLSDKALVRRTCDDLRRAAELRAEPDFTAVWRHPLGIPQYTLGHAQRCATIAKDLQPHAGLFITGNALRGVGVADCIGNAQALAAQWTSSQSPSVFPDAALAAAGQ